jgi:hypothetical protein
MDNQGKEKKEQKPLDAKLLSDAVIELNISRRSVGLYPPEHPITRQSIQNAHELMKKLFEIRHSITLGVAKDVLMVDEYTLDKKNPVYIEFALALHSKGIASVTFYSGLEENELQILHELISNPDFPPGRALLNLDKYKELRHVRFVPVDASKFKFVEDGRKTEKVSRQMIWEDYVYGLLEGKLADKDSEGVFLSIPPDDLATIISSYPSETDEGYDRVITNYLSRKGRKGLTRESLNKFMELVENLSPNVKEQFLSRAVKHPLLNQRENEEILGELTPEDIERMMSILQREVKLPESLRNLIDKLSEVRGRRGKEEPFDVTHPRVDDIELSSEVVELFQEDQFWDYVDEQYQKDLEKILKSSSITGFQLSLEVRDAFSQIVLDREFSGLILELINYQEKKHEDHMKMLGQLRELTDMFLDTGRLEEMYTIYTAFNRKMLAGKFERENREYVDGYFHSEQFISKLLDAFAIWGRDHRGASEGLAKSLKGYLMNPLFDMLNHEERPAQRKFYISVLSGLGKDALKEAVQRMDDERWYVVRNMIYIIRECGGTDYIAKIRPLTNNKNKRIGFEAIKTLVHFKTPDAFSRLRVFLTGKSPYLKEQAIRLLGAYKIKEAVPDLLDILEKPDRLGSEQHYKPLVIQSLGKIGDPGVLKTLKGMFTSRSLLYKSAQRQLKLEIIRSLENYPFKYTKPILEVAMMSGDSQLRTAAQKVYSRIGDV